MSATLWHRFAAQATAKGGNVAICHGDRTASFADLLGATCGWACVLDAAPGDRVVIAGANSIDLAAAVPAIWAKGAIPVFVNADAPDSHLRHAIAQTGAVTLLTDRARDAGFSAAVHQIGAHQIGAHQIGAHQIAAQPAAGMPVAPGQSGAAPGSIVYTSGSSGAPKGVVQRAETLASGVDRIGAMLGYRATERILCPIPFAFDYGWGQLLSVLLGGCSLILPETRGGAGICDALNRHRPTVFAGVPAVFADLLSGLAPIGETDRSSVRLITNTGSRLPDAVRQGLVALFPDAELSLNYGLTETYRSASLPVAMAASHPASVGFAVTGAVLLVLRTDGTEAGVGEEGEVVHGGAGVFHGYWADPDRTAQVLRPDPLWQGEGDAPQVVFTGDLGHKDAAGRLYLHGRRDRQMKSMGVRVAPDEVEALLADSGLLREVAVVSRPHDTVGDLIVAVVALPEGADAAHSLKLLKRHARDKMSPFMQPRDHIVLPALPRNPNGKVDYPALKRLATGQEGQDG